MGNKSILYIVGNGFDLYHGIPSSYKDFYNYLLNKVHEYNYPNCDICNSLHLLDYIYGSELWSDFEARLGKPNINAIRKTAEIERARSASVVKTFDDYACNVVERLGGYLKYFLSNWAHSLSLYVDKCGRRLNICDKRDDMFFTFNYTNMLENAYLINPNNIYHIHRDSNLDNITPIDDDINIIDCIYGYWLPNGQIYEDNISDIPEAIKLYSDYMKKPIEQIMQSDEWYKWFGKNGKARNINDIYVLGHSLNDIDMPYFIAIAQKCSRAKWHVSYYTEEDKIRIEQQLKNLGVPYELNTIDKVLTTTPCSCCYM